MTWYTCVIITISYGIELFICINIKIRIFKGNIFATLYRYFSDTKYWAPVKVTSIAGNLNWSAAQGHIRADNVTLKKNILCDVLEINLTNGQLQLNDNDKNLPMSITIKFR